MRRLARARKLMCRTHSAQETYWVDLNEVRAAHAGEYLSSRSSNTRQQLRKARRLAGQHLGALELEVASSPGQAKEWLHSLGRLHQKRWSSDDPDVGFNNPLFSAFYEQFIDEEWAKGRPWVVKISAGLHVLAYFFCILDQGHVYFLMSGIDYADKTQFRPGMLAHWLAIEEALRQGFNTYDFLQGSARYKESLCSAHGAMESLIVQRPTWYFVLEEGIRRLKHRMQNEAEKRPSDE